MSKVTVYTKHNCPQCEVTKIVLKDEGIEFNTINIEDDQEAMEYVKDVLGFSSTPVIVADGHEPFSGFQPDKLKELKY
ncbi:glutaredoxin-like protein NrdH [Caldifermentibacillus hisashii]|uniref:Glutaredoxin-like protein NrdH n=1 Tax=Caldifermentibacillus hisashii TaxID=996558 RepID=A0ABU9K5Y7_9BACI